MNVLATASLPLENGRYTMPTLPSAQGLSAKTIDKTSKLYQACEDFQAVFIKQMLDTMRQTVDKSGSILKDNQGAKVFEDMLYDEYSKNMSKTAGFDLADNLYRQMAYLANVPRTNS